MSLSVIHTRAVSGVAAISVKVEVHLGGGLPSLSIVGLPEAAVKESKDRVRAALLNAGFEFPARRITLNLAPADLPKHGGRFDLPIAIGILAASGQLPETRVGQFEFVGELALSGDIRPVPGVLPTAIQATKAGHKLIVPKANAEEAGLCQQAEIFAAEHLMQVCRHFSGDSPLPLYQSSQSIHNHVSCHSKTDLKEVKGQYLAKRALEIAAAGNHNLLFTGPPGTGKSMLASRLTSILPPMTETEALETAAVVSVSHQTMDHKKFLCRPFRAPHHTASGAALVGGGSKPQPGEISLAHNGVLFLDELPEFSRRVLDVLREPLETGHITISRASQQADFPARFQLITAMNPCPCGHYGEEAKECRCSPNQIARYQSRISGPLLDRIDLHVTVPRLDISELREPKQPAESSAEVRQRVMIARNCQLKRTGKCNAWLNTSEIEKFCQLQSKDYDFLEQAMQRLQLSMRAYTRILKVARTVADLAGESQIGQKHLLEALAFRESLQKMK